MPDIHHGSYEFDMRKARAEGRRQDAHRRAHRDYHQAAAAERKLWEEKVKATRVRLRKAEEPIQFIDHGYEPGSGKTEFDKAFAALDAAKAAVDALPPAPDHAALRRQMQAAIDAADRSFNDAGAAGFPA